MNNKAILGNIAPRDNSPTISTWIDTISNKDIQKFLQGCLLRADTRHIEFGWLLGNSAVHRSLAYFDYICWVVDSLVL